MGSILMDIDSTHILRVDITSDVVATVNDENTLAPLMRFMRKDRPKEPRSP